MGNNYSNDELNGRMAGNFLTMLGFGIVAVICPPAAPLCVGGAIASNTYTIIDAATSKRDKDDKPGDFASGCLSRIFLDGKLQAGGSYREGDKMPQPHITTIGHDVIKEREQREDKIKIQQIEINMIKKEDQNKINTQIKNSNFKVDYFDVWKSYINNNTTKFSKSNEIKTYNFIEYNINEKNDVKSFTKDMICKKDDPVVERIYVIRRKLDDLPVFLGWMAHSGLLLKTKDGRWFICEYGVEVNQNEVSLYEVKNIDRTSNNFTHNKRKWKKQICGSNIEKEISISSVKDTMKTFTGKHSYSKILWNCHMAQENTREKLGLKVDNKYLNSEYEKEWHMTLCLDARG
jgi:hypothetical protein